MNASGPGRPEALDLLELAWATHPIWMLMWEPNSDPLPKQYALLTAEPSLPPFVLHLCYTVIYFVCMCVCGAGRENMHAWAHVWQESILAVHLESPGSWVQVIMLEQASSFPHWAVLLALHLILFNGFFSILSIFSSFMPHSFFFLPISGRKTNKQQKKAKSIFSKRIHF